MKTHEERITALDQARDALAMARRYRDAATEITHGRGVPTVTVAGQTLALVMTEDEASTGTERLGDIGHVLAHHLNKVAANLERIAEEGARKAFEEGLPF